MAEYQCANCGIVLAQYQIDEAIFDAGYLFDDCSDRFKFYCTGYNDTSHTCEGNDSDAMACWRVD